MNNNCDEVFERVEGLYSTDEEEFPSIDNRDSLETWVWVDSNTHYRVYRNQLFTTPEVEEALNSLNTTSEEMEEIFVENN
jgi:hypothetical protein